MKRFIILLLTGALALLLLAGCSRKEKTPGTEEVPSASSSSQVTEPEEKPEPELPPQPDASRPEPEETPEPEPGPEQDAGVLTEPVKTARQAYAQVLLRLLHDHVFPDGRADGFDPALYDMSENKFAVFDVDGDGREELVIEYITTAVAEHRGLVLNYDPAGEEIGIQLDEYPAPAFFDNGAVLVHWSHNQGKGGAFWPYSLYVYRPEQDSYSFVGSVDAWDSSVDPEHYPAEVDVSGTGFVYYLSSGAPNEELTPVDDAVYQAWLEPYIGSAGIVVPDFMALTEENIRQMTDDVTQEQAPVPAS